MTENLLDRIMNKHIDKLVEEKQKIINQRLCELGLKMDKRIFYRKEGKKESVYYDDGSDKGLRIVTFEFKISYQKIGKLNECNNFIAKLIYY